MKTGENWANHRGPVPGNPKAVRQHQAVAQGYVVADTERKVETNQREGKTGTTDAPGLTSRPIARKM